MDLDEIFKKWSKWLEEIHHEVLNLAGCRFVYYEVRDMVNSNPKLQLPSVFWTHFMLSYIAYEIMAIRRQVNYKDKDSISLARLLKEIINCPSVLSRQRFYSIYNDDFFDLKAAEDDYLRFYNTTKNYIDPDSVQKDYDELIQKGEKCKAYADKILAHCDIRGLSELEKPNYEDMDKCIDYIELLAKKYSEIFHSKTINTLPIYPYDWKAIFRIPWIES